MHYLYIIKSVNYPKTYVGITVNIVERLNSHNLGYSRFTRNYKPWKLIHSEKLSARIEVREREKYFKSATGRKKIKKMLSNK